VRHLIALHDGGDSVGLELSGNAIAGMALEMSESEQRSELARGMSGQQHEYACVRAACGKPVGYGILG
jgi:hypothetical protein